jgi:hypothetical protein
MARRSKFDTDTTLAESHPARLIGENDYVRTFYSLRDFAETADKCPSGTNAESNRPAWIAGEGFEHEGTREAAMEMAMGEGWQMIKPMVDAINLHVSRLVDASTIADSYGWRYDVAGSAVDVAAYLQGEPECMVDLEPVRVAKRGKVVRLIVPAQYNHTVTRETRARRGAALCALIDALTVAQYSVEIWAILSGSSRTRFSYAVKIQDAAAPYRSEMIAYALGHGTMLRKLSFLVMDQDCSSTRTMAGRGSPAQSRLVDIPVELQDGPAIVLPMLQGNERPWTGSDEDIARWIEHQVASITGAE